MNIYESPKTKSLKNCNQALRKFRSILRIQKIDEGRKKMCIAQLEGLIVELHDCSVC
jgi:hypothetical protein